MEEIIELINRLGDLILEKKGQYKEEIKKLTQELSDEKLYGSETISLYEDSINEYKQLVDEKNHLISELEERLKKNETKESDISTLEKEIKALELKNKETEKKFEEAKRKIQELENQLKEEIPVKRSEDDTLYAYKFGRTSKRIMTKCVDFLGHLFNGQDSGEIIILQNPEAAKKLADINDKQFNVFMDRLTSMKINGTPVLYKEGSDYKTKFKYDFLCDYLTQIIA
jgi:seryl-tRNA synthetase